MKPLKLYKVETEAYPAMHVAARSNPQAAQIYSTWAASVGRPAGGFSVDLVLMEALVSEQQPQLQSLLEVSTEGIAWFEEAHGWSIDSGGWTSFDPTEREER
jgi:hypothetical protein